MIVEAAAIPPNLPEFETATKYVLPWLAPKTMPRAANKRDFIW